MNGFKTTIAAGALAATVGLPGCSKAPDNPQLDKIETTTTETVNKSEEILNDYSTLGRANIITESYQVQLNEEFQYKNILATPKTPEEVVMYRKAIDENKKNGPELSNINENTDTPALLRKAMLQSNYPHRAVFGTAKKIILSGNSYYFGEQSGIEGVYVNATTNGTEKFPSFNLKRIIFYPLHSDGKRKEHSFSDFMEKISLSDIVEFSKGLTMEEKRFLKEAYYTYKTFFENNKDEINALVEKDVELQKYIEENPHIYERNRNDLSYQITNLVETFRSTHEGEFCADDENCYTEMEKIRINEELKNIKEYNFQYDPKGRSTKSKHFHKETSDMKGIEEFRAFFEKHGVEFEHETGVNSLYIKSMYRWFNDPVRVKLMETLNATVLGDA